MKTAGILTTYFASNFGAMLQPFALKRTLEQMGLEVEILRYKQPAIGCITILLLGGVLRVVKVRIL